MNAFKFKSPQMIKLSQGLLLLHLLFTLCKTVLQSDFVRFDTKTNIQIIFMELL
jgi:hypothetical protein